MMQRNVTRWMSLLTLVALEAACGRDNETACRDYVAAHNAAYEACDDPLRLDEDDACPSGLNGGRDCTEYYDRLAESYACQSDGTVTFDATGDCV